MECYVFALPEALCQLAPRQGDRARLLRPGLRVGKLLGVHRAGGHAAVAILHGLGMLVEVAGGVAEKESCKNSYYQGTVCGEFGD